MWSKRSDMTASSVTYRKDGCNATLVRYADISNGVCTVLSWCRMDYKCVTHVRPMPVTVGISMVLNGFLNRESGVRIPLGAVNK